MRGWRWLLLAAIAAGCRTGDAHLPVRLIVREHAAGAALELLPQHGVKINARLAPVLDTEDGRLARFTASALTPDSAYFAAPPSAVIDLSPQMVRGTLRVSICNDGEQVCRALAFAVAGERLTPTAP